jgi:TonB family protein
LLVTHFFQFVLRLLNYAPAGVRIAWNQSSACSVAFQRSFVLIASSIGARGFVLGASALLHVAVFAVAAHGSKHADGLSLADAAQTTESEIIIDTNREPIAEEEATHANHVHTHTHAYPVSADHDLIDHDPSIVHTPLAPHDHDHESAHASTPPNAPADAPSDVMTAPASAPAALPNFSISIGASTTAHGFALSNGTGNGATSHADTEAPVEEDHVSLAAHLVQSVLPAYPADAREEGIEADVPLEIVVDKSGAVKSASPLAHAGYGFDESALSAIHHYRFSPAARSGQAVAVRMKWVVQFRLK